MCLLLSTGACGKSEPVYSGISVQGFNYLPYNLEDFTVTDAYGNKAGGGGDNPPGAGEGSFTCCYKLKGTEFTVRWGYYDVDQWHKGDKQEFHAEAKVTMPPSPVPDKIGTRILNVHFYPDHHVEMAFPGKMLGDTRMPIVEVSKWMDRYQAQLDQRYDEREDQTFRRVARVIAGAWVKYHLVNQEDLQQYTYFNLLVNKHFDAHPEVQKLLQRAKDAPGQFSQAMQALSSQVLAELKSNQFKPVPVPAIPDGLLPPPRVKENDDE
nr:DUF3304 domain-containing protein [Ralstonia sp. UBA689]